MASSSSASGGVEYPSIAVRDGQCKKCHSSTEHLEFLCEACKAYLNRVSETFRRHEKTIENWNPEQSLCHKDDKHVYFMVANGLGEILIYLCFYFRKYAMVLDALREGFGWVESYLTIHAKIKSMETFLNFSDAVHVLSLSRTLLRPVHRHVLYLDTDRIDSQGYLPFLHRYSTFMYKLSQLDISTSYAIWNETNRLRDEISQTETTTLESAMMSLKGHEEKRIGIFSKKTMRKLAFKLNSLEEKLESLEWNSRLYSPLLSK